MKEYSRVRERDDDESVKTNSDINALLEELGENIHCWGQEGTLMGVGRVSQPK